MSMEASKLTNYSLYSSSVHLRNRPENITAYENMFAHDFCVALFPGGPWYHSYFDMTSDIFQNFKDLR